MYHFINFISQSFRKKSLADQLTMSILCKNEVDIIEQNIRTHALLGVDSFAVMDNNSTDGTRELLDELSNEFNLLIIDEKGQYQQAKWMKRLAHLSRQKLNASWVINNDADEFWIPKNSSTDLKDFLLPSDSVVTVKRSNMIITEDIFQSDYDFTKATHKVQYPICYDKTTQKNNSEISMIYAPIKGKTIINPNGFIKLSGGNHRAKHLGQFFTARQEQDIEIYHYPIRSFAQFKANIENRKKLLKNPNIRMGEHYRRWVSLLDEGKLEQEFNRFISSSKELETLDKFSIVKEDLVPSKLFKKLNENA